MSKKAYKQLQKKLTDKFIKPNGDGYQIKGGVRAWLEQCGIKKKQRHDCFIITYNIFGSVPYPYQKADRKVILKYLKKHSYKDFKNDANNNK